MYLCCIRLLNRSNISCIRPGFSQSNRILKIEGLDSLVNLDQLYLSHNGIEKIEGLDKLVSHHKYNVLVYCTYHPGMSHATDTMCSCVISMLMSICIILVPQYNSLFRFQTKLTTLDLAVNRISRIENVSHLTLLEEFWVSHTYSPPTPFISALPINTTQSFQFNGNKLDTWEDLELLSPCTRLETIYLEHNPLWRDKDNERSVNPSYRRKVMLALPWIRQIDATYCR